MSSEVPSDAAARLAPAEEEKLRELMVRYQRAEPAAVDELVTLLSPRIWRFLGTSPDAEDLLQDCWLRIHRARHTYRSSEPVLPWLYAIARHTRLDAYRRRRRRERREVLVAEMPEYLAHAPARTAGFEGLLRMLDNLPPSQREVIHMLKVSGLSLEEVARATSSTVGAIKQKAHRAYARLREALKESHARGT